MNKPNLLFHLKEAKEQLDELVEHLSKINDTDQIDFNGEITVGMQHLYHHLNTAWNGRHDPEDLEETDDVFYKRRKFPTDIEL